MTTAAPNSTSGRPENRRARNGRQLPAHDEPREDDRTEGEPCDEIGRVERPEERPTELRQGAHGDCDGRAEEPDLTGRHQIDGSDSEHGQQHERYGGLRAHLDQHVRGGESADESNRSQRNVVAGSKSPPHVSTRTRSDPRCDSARDPRPSR